MLNKVPIPGESLTLPPGQAPYERKVRIHDPEEALKAHLKRLDGKEEDILDMLSMGIPLQTVVEGVLRTAVYNSVHNVDTSLVIAPVIHKYISGFAKAAGIQYKEWSDEEVKVDPKQRAMEVGRRLAVPINPPKRPEPKQEEKIVKRRGK